ncbi:hypothetical protein RI367_005794 [Sorochytrium milnesiophthora]
MRRRPLVTAMEAAGFQITERDYDFLQTYMSTETDIYEADIVLDGSKAVVLLPMAQLGQYNVGEDRPYALGDIIDLLLRFSSRYKRILLIMEQPAGVAINCFVGPVHRGWKQLQDVCEMLSRSLNVLVTALQSCSPPESAWIMRAACQAMPAQDRTWIRDDTSLHEQLLTVFVNPFVAQWIMHIFADAEASALHCFFTMSQQDMHDLLYEFLTAQQIDYLYGLITSPLQAT